MVGLVCRDETHTHYYHRVTHDEADGKVLGIVLTGDGVYDELTNYQIKIADCPRS